MMNAIVSTSVIADASLNEDYRAVRERVSLINM